MDRQLVWVLLTAFWVVTPVLALPGPVRWGCHLVVVATAGLVLVPRVAASPRRQLLVPVLAALLCALSLLLALALCDARFPAYEMESAALTGLAHVLLFLLVFALVPGPDESAAQLALTTRAALGLSLLALVGAQVVVVVASGAPDDDGRLAGTLGNPNVLGSVLAASALAVGALARWRPVAVALAAVLGLGVLATRSRGALAAGMLVLLVLVWRRSRRAAGVLLLAAAALLWLVPNPLTERVLALRTGHTYPRPYLWAVAAEHVAEHPAGIGPAMNKYVFPPHGRHPEYPWLLHQRHGVGLTHNVFLTLTLEWGWLAGAAALLLAAWAAGRHLPRRPVDPLQQGAALGAAVLLVELQVDGLEQNAPVFALALVLAGTALQRLPGRRAGPGLPGRAVALLVLLACLALLALGAVRLARWWPQQSAAGIVEAYGRGEVTLDATRAALERAERSAPRDPAPAWARAQLEGRLLRELLLADAPPEQTAGVAAAAGEALARARAAQPVEPELLAAEADLARMVWRRGGGGEPARARFFATMEELLTLDPLDTAARLELVREAWREGFHDLARRHFEELVAIEPDHAEAWALWASWREAEGALEQALAAWVRCEEAIYNCRVKAAVDQPHSRRVFERILGLVDVDAVRERVAALRRQLYL